MLTVIQRVSRAAVRVDGEVVGAIERGAMLLVAVERGDVDADAIATAKKIASLRFFPGATPMDRTLAEVGGGVLVVSQFTLAGSLRKGRRPSFEGAELPERARALYEAVAAALRAEGLEVATGRFAAHMEVDLVNDGPVTFLLRSVAGQVQ
ncbi:D-aminoacyl-tRNA deacylase [Nannocystis bainbridge]|uniref:D-aminoacyl-tRNA deacylase n=1 Tax=Nannocystis bainbridge TaxID=2995303 RepID=A0ABT5E3J6_9BACT|nr:D-aminoacyl-tRNA deacylase [Nannocystis bainbridge]MDC0719889.1 D-aminoacyl-tRNA deacylase [Nannocystis bainbridge]